MREAGNLIYDSFDRILREAGSVLMTVLNRVKGKPGTSLKTVLKVLVEARSLFKDSSEGPRGGQVPL